MERLSNRRLTSEVAADGDPASTRTIARVALECLSDGEVEDYFGLAYVLAEVEAWEALSAVIGKAAEDSDPEIRGVSRSFTESHGGMLP